MWRYLDLNAMQSVDTRIANIDELTLTFGIIYRINLTFTCSFQLQSATDYAKITRIAKLIFLDCGRKIQSYRNRLRHEGLPQHLHQEERVHVHTHNNQTRNVRTNRHLYRCLYSTGIRLQLCNLLTIQALLCNPSTMQGQFAICYYLISTF